MKLASTCSFTRVDQPKGKALQPPGGGGHSFLISFIGPGSITENRFKKHETTTCSFTNTRDHQSQREALPPQPSGGSHSLISCLGPGSFAPCVVLPPAPMLLLLFLSTPRLSPRPSVAALSFDAAPLAPPHPLLLFLNFLR